METNFCAILRAEETVTRKGLHITMPEIGLRNRPVYRATVALGTEFGKTE